jgi:hypothetical protein
VPCLPRLVTEHGVRKGTHTNPSKRISEKLAQMYKVMPYRDVVFLPVMPVEYNLFHLPDQAK